MTAWLERQGAAIRGLTGWRRFLFAFGAGLFSALGFAPVEFFPALLLGFAALVLLLDGARQSPHPVRKAAVAGWAFAFGQYLLGWHWIGYAFMVDPSAHLWQMPFALLILTGGLALYAGIACGLAMRFWRNGVSRLLVFALLYAAAEWVRGHALTGFPWNLPAYGWGASWAVMQSASLFGAYGLSFLTILLGAALAEFCSSSRRLAAPSVMIALFAGLWAYGAIRLAETPAPDVPGVRLRLVQPDIPQNEKYGRRYVRRNWERLIELSERPGPVTHIVWPEAAPPFLLDRSQVALEQIAALTEGGKSLITGATRASEGADPVFYNSLYVFGPGGKVEAVYDKFHLVPFGEYVPFADLLGRFGITKLTQGEGGFASGDGPHIYRIPGAPAVTPLICYEIIFPGAVTADQRPGWLVNVTDDSWFGPWAGPLQHLLIARVRAIEEGLPVARAANTGISAMIDPMGRLRDSLNLGRLGVVDTPLPAALAPTPYAHFGDLIFAALLLAALAAAIFLARKEAR
ncbi:MAG: apolipoprotein N-acyltransferase [Alphaproteobacteria bacterium]|nr:apolipoprotein N-acyltransferase [Alphaproteobacteria bacterium]